MKIACPKCESAVSVSQSKCPACGFSFRLGDIVTYYWKKTTRWFQFSSELRCPSCHVACPMTARACPACGTGLTVSAAVNETLNPARKRWRAFLDDITPDTKRHVQWVYLLLSVTVLWWLLAYIEEHNASHWLDDALLSIIYLASFGRIALLIVPKRLIRVVARNASLLVKFSLILNYLSLMLTLQIMIGSFWMRATILAGVFFGTFVAAWIFCCLFWPLSLQVRLAFEEENLNKPFDPSAPQGRNAKFD